MIIVSRVARMTRPLRDGVVAAALAHLAPRVEPLQRLLAPHQFQRAQQTQAPCLADQRVRRKLRPALLQVRGGDVPRTCSTIALALQDPQVLQRHGAANRVAGVGKAVGELPALARSAWSATRSPTMTPPIGR